MESNYFELLPSELIQLIIEYVDLYRNKCGTKLFGISELNSKDPLYPYYVTYINNIYNGYINPFKKDKIIDFILSSRDKYISNFSDFGLLANQINSKIYDFMSYIDHIDIKLQTDFNVKIKDALFYQFSDCKENISIQKDNVYYHNNCDSLYIILSIDNRFYYIRCMKLVILSLELSSKIQITIKRYDIWKEIHNNLRREDIQQLYNTNKYSLPKDKFKSHKGNVFGNLFVYGVDIK